MMFNWLFRKTAPESPLFRLKSDITEDTENPEPEWTEDSDLGDDGNGFDITIADVHQDYAARHEGSGSYNMYFYKNSEIKYTKKLGRARYSIICEDGTEYVLMGMDLAQGVDPTYYDARDDQEQ